MWSFQSEGNFELESELPCSLKRRLPVLLVPVIESLPPWATLLPVMHRPMGLLARTVALARFGLGTSSRGPSTHKDTALTR
ncbi:hypothetical protein AAFF_G00044750 [Aldrovandia affinis]|uniref:Uncharacterized protein n=1 Tax=Aldrovandia affinis TaxID=143900 RepID=A0AAD7S2R5_9TELE|nr:hypothetical protein AAFF_G00044750 [Aldrovandia affinis]